jgi:hypothetical protein
MNTFLRGAANLEILKDGNCDVLADSHNTLNRWKNYFYQLLHTHNTSDDVGCRFGVYMKLQLINNHMIYLISYYLLTIFMEVFQMFQELFTWADLLLQCCLHYRQYILKIKMTAALPQHGTQNLCIHPVNHSTIFFISSIYLWGWSETKSTITAATYWPTVPALGDTW